MLAQQPSISLPQPRTEPIDRVEPISLKRIAAILQVVLATRRAAYTEEDTYWHTLALQARLPIRANQ